MHHRVSGLILLALALAAAQQNCADIQANLDVQTKKVDIGYGIVNHLEQVEDAQLVLKNIAIAVPIVVGVLIPVIVLVIVILVKIVKMIIVTVQDQLGE